MRVEIAAEGAMACAGRDEALHQKDEYEQDSKSSHGAIISTCTSLQKRERTGRGCRCALIVPTRRKCLEEEFPAELHHAWIVGAGDLSELRVGETGIDVLKFGVVEGIEGLEADFNVRPFVRAKWNALEQRDIPVEEPGTDDGIFAGTSEALVYASLPWRQWSRKRAGIEPLQLRFGTTRRADEVGTVDSSPPRPSVSVE